MIDDTDSPWSDGSEDPADKITTLPPAVVFATPCDDNELRAEEAMYLQAAGCAISKDGVPIYMRKPDDKYFGCAEPVFLGEDDEDGNERISNDEAGRWRAIMSWPRMPTLEEITLFKRSRESALVRDNWGRLVEARAADVKAAADKEAARQAAIVAQFGDR